jgi:hypothetical protein
MIDHLRVFECICYVHNNKQDKFYTLIKAIFLGYLTKKRNINAMIYLIKRVTYQEM